MWRQNLWTLQIKLLEMTKGNIKGIFTVEIFLQLDLDSESLKKPSAVNKSSKYGIYYLPE